MIFCSKCFCDMEIKPIIEGLRQRGNCSVCGSHDAFIYDTEKNDALTESFNELVSIYTPAKSLPAEFPKLEVDLLKVKLLTDWNIFNGLSSSNVYNIITNICRERYQQIPELFDSSVGIAELYSAEHIKKHSLLKMNSWEEFVFDLKTRNRFHTNYINLEILEKFCSYIRKPYKKGTIFYRGRISPVEGYSTDEMTAPPSEKATAGRANSQGISCLYLADAVETTIHEVRAGAFDYICVGKFELQDDIIVVDLKSIDKISPFIEGLDLLEHAINKDHLKKINIEMGKALRRSDSILDYVATQYISDFIKSLNIENNKKYAGLEYNSTMNPNGFNLAVFYPDLFKCKDVNVIKIEGLRYYYTSYK